MAGEEGARKTGFFIVVYKLPDVCKTPMGSATPPIPYAIIADLGSSTGVSPDVNFTGCPAFMLDKSKVPKSDGDNAGTAGGVKSGTFLKECEPKKGSQTVRINKAYVIRHGDPFWMNNKNTEGTLVFLGLSAGGCGVASDGSPAADTSPPVQPTEEEKGWLEKLGDWWEQTKKEGRAAFESPGQGTIGAAKGTANIVPQSGNLLFQGSMLQSAGNMQEAAAMQALFGNQQMADELWRMGDQMRAAAPGASPFPTFSLDNAAQVGGDKIATAISLLTGLAGLAKKAPGLLGRLGKAADVTGDLARTEQALATAAKGEQALATAAKGEQALATAAKGEQALATTAKGEQALATTAKGEQAAAKGAPGGGAKPKPGQDGTRITKAPPSLREQYLGRTPGKGSKTGKEVIAREKAAGTVRDGPNGLEFKSKVDGEWYPIQQADMSHNVDAVSWWNETGRFYGAKAPEVRQWMLNSSNYHLELFSYNRSAGAQLGINYLPPVPRP